MTEQASPITNHFCWLDLNSNDPAAAKKFYSAIFGWELSDMPMGDDTYTMAQVGGKNVAGVMKLAEQAKAMGAPPHWLSYVAVDDVDQAVQKASKLGAKVLVPGMQAGPGRMAVLQDPSGGVFAIWHSDQSMGVWVRNEKSTLCWNELMTNNVDVAGKFYSEMFGWKPEAVPMPGMTYTLFKEGDAQIAGMMAFPPEAKDAMTSWAVYFAVESCDGTVAEVKKLGGKLAVGPMDIPNIGRFAVLEDPEGAMFAVLQPSS